MPGIAAAINAIAGKQKTDRIAFLKADFPIPIDVEKDQRARVYYVVPRDPKSRVVVYISFEEWDQICNTAGFTELVAEKMRYQAMLNRIDRGFQKKSTTLHTYPTDDHNCPGCGAPITNEMIRCRYCRRPLQHQDDTVLRHFSYRKGVKVCDATVRVTSTTV